MFETILVPIDDSPGSQRAFEAAVTLAKQYGSAVHVLAVVDEHGPSDGEWDYDGDSPAAAFLDEQSDAADGVDVTPAVGESPS